MPPNWLPSLSISPPKKSSERNDCRDQKNDRKEAEDNGPSNPDGRQHPPPGSVDVACQLEADE
jgi:hypothetical protein